MFLSWVTTKRESGKEIPISFSRTSTGRKLGFTSLLLETQFLNYRIVPTLVVRLEVTEMYTAIGDHLQKAATRMEILRILLEVLCEFVDLLRKDSDLDVR